MNAEPAEKFKEDTNMDTKITKKDLQEHFRKHDTLWVVAFERHHFTRRLALDAEKYIKRKGWIVLGSGYYHHLYHGIKVEAYLFLSVIARNETAYATLLAYHLYQWVVVHVYRYALLRERHVGYLQELTLRRATLSCKRIEACKQLAPTLFFI